MSTGREGGGGLGYSTRVGFLVYREPGEYNLIWGYSRPGLSPPGRVNDASLAAAGPQFTEVQILWVNFSCSGTFGNDYIYIKWYILEDVYL